jgi:hypothetical protein
MSRVCDARLRLPAVWLRKIRWKRPPRSERTAHFPDLTLVAERHSNDRHARDNPRLRQLKLVGSSNCEIEVVPGQRRQLLSISIERVVS